MLEQLLTQYKSKYTADDLPYLSATALYTGPFDGCGGPLRRKPFSIGTFSGFTLGGIGPELPELESVRNLREAKEELNRNIGVIGEKIPLSLEDDWKLRMRFDFDKIPHINYDMITGKTLTPNQEKFYDNWDNTEPTHSIPLTGFSVEDSIQSVFNKKKKPFGPTWESF